MDYDEAINKMTGALCEAVFGTAESQLEGRDADAAKSFRTLLQSSVNMGREIVIQEVFFALGTAEGRNLFGSDLRQRCKLQEDLNEILTALLG